jgi:16S rRNA (guanine(966)-N(2))-methyltransferase RsmD
MRIIAGKFRGHRITPPSRIDARPTTDYAREGLFNVLHNRVHFPELKVLDLFAGTGAVSFEFYSRGVEDILSVDKAPLSYTFISQMAEKLEMKGLKPLRADVFEFLKKHHQKYDFIFADPPYAMENIDEVHKLIMENELLEEDGELILEHSEHNDFSHLSGFSEKRSYGSVNFSFFSR